MSFHINFPSAIGAGLVLAVVASVVFVLSGVALLDKRGRQYQLRSAVLVVVLVLAGSVVACLCASFLLLRQLISDL